MNPNKANCYHEVAIKLEDVSYCEKITIDEVYKAKNFIPVTGWLFNRTDNIKFLDRKTVRLKRAGFEVRCRIHKDKKCLYRQLTDREIGHIAAWGSLCGFKN